MTETIGGKPEEKGITIVGGGKVKGVKVLDKESKTPQPPITVTVGEGDKG